MQCKCLFLLSCQLCVVVIIHYFNSVVTIAPLLLLTKKCVFAVLSSYTFNRVKPGTSQITLFTMGNMYILLSKMPILFSYIWKNSKYPKI